MSDLRPFLLLFPASALLAMALAAAGAHLATRQRTLQSLCLAQGAELGALASVLALATPHDALERAGTWMGLGGSFAGAVIAGSLASVVSIGMSASRTTRLFALWLSLIAFTHVSVAFHPALESHLARVFLGDLATLSDPETMAAGAMGALASTLLLARHSAYARETFDVSVLGLPSRSSFGSVVEGIPFLLLPALSTWAAGFLFTCAFLFLPTAFLSRNGDSSRVAILLCAGVSGTVAPLALLMSLRFETLPTVPAMVVLLCVACGTIRLARGGLRATEFTPHPRSEEG